MLIVFDFDGTIAKSTQLHKKGWEQTLYTLGLKNSLEHYLPYESSLRESFDSRRRIKNGFLGDPITTSKLNQYFRSTDPDFISSGIMDLKENYTISHILESDTYDLINMLANNITELLILLKSKKYKIGIISSTRRSIISSYLIKTNLIDMFDIVIGEEDMYDGNLLRDKPDKYAGLILSIKLGQRINYYIGDNAVIDKEFAYNYGCEFLFSCYQSDMLSIKL